MTGMLVKPDQLLSLLDKQQHQLPPLIWICGDEPLLVQEASDSVRRFTRDHGFTDREVHDAGAQFNWNVLLEATSNLSLFSDKKLIELRLHSPKLDNDAKGALQAYLDNPGEDNLLLVTSDRVDKAALSTKWFKAIESRGIVVQVWPVNARDLPGWIAQRIKKAGLTADQDCIDIICHRVEGNLLAAAQEIDKLAVLVSESHLTRDIVARAVADSSRFNVFALIDATLAGDSGKALNILNHLQAEGDDPLKILFFLTKEIRILLRMQAKINQGQNINGVMQGERVWQNRIAPVSTALRNHTPDSLEQLLLHARLVDQSVKGLMKLKPWDELTDMVMALADPGFASVDAFG
jgi:DNA polymerase-3 subunit delta